MQNNREEINEVATSRIGARIKGIREKGGRTVEELATQTGIDSEVLSRIETNEFIPPLATLFKIANAFGVDIADFFQERSSSEKIVITRRDETVRIGRRPDHDQGEVDYIYEALAVKQNFRHMEPFLVEFPLQEISEMVFNSHEGEEFLHVLEGTVEFRSTDRVEVLNPGDNIYFQSDVSHSFRRISKGPARAIAVIWNKRP
ncbi:MAG: XRE family transcriptional regulator [Deltaproteobacteria bacterium]|jgi:transcriptional regulator with XRE-family HTH domain|nr:XRE family transcriptional regulator [Deltaproteobacteria bacterium]